MVDFGYLCDFQDNINLNPNPNQPKIQVVKVSLRNQEPIAVAAHCVFLLKFDPSKSLFNEQCPPPLAPSKPVSLRNMVVAKPGYKILSADYAEMVSQMQT
jgi:hypothetical protein